MPSLTLLSQALITGILAGSLYGLLALGLSLSWGLLRLVNLSHFAMAFLGAYLTWYLGTAAGIPAYLSGPMIVAAFFRLWRGAALGVHALRRRRDGVDAHHLQHRGDRRIGAAVHLDRGFPPLRDRLCQLVDRRRPALRADAQPLACLMAALLAGLTWAWLRFTYVGKALRAGAEDAPIAAAFGINHRALSFLLSGLCAAYAGIAGVFIALIARWRRRRYWTWIGVVFAVVIIGRLGNPIGALGGGILIGSCEAITMAVVNPASAPLVSFSVLIALLLFRPRWGLTARARWRRPASSRW